MAILRNAKGQFILGHGGLPRARIVRGKVVSCETCGKRVYSMPSQVGRPRWCSYACRAKAQRNGEDWICPVCGKSFYRSQAVATVRGKKVNYCSRKCARRSGEGRAGPLSGRWRGSRIRPKAIDNRFSLFIRARDGFQCLRCGRQYTPRDRGLQCSHFIGRANQSGRFDEENCDSLCRGCHQFFETHKATIYREWKMERLGSERFEGLVLRSRLVTKRTPADKEALRFDIEQRLVNAVDVLPPVLRADLETMLIERRAKVLPAAVLSARPQGDVDAEYERALG